MTNPDSYIKGKLAVAKAGLKKSLPASNELPAGQRLVSKMVAMAPIVRDLTETPRDKWQLKIYGSVANPVTLDWQSLHALGIEDKTFDIHCVTSWSKLGQKFKGVDFYEILNLVHPTEDARYVIFESDNDGYTTNVSLDELLAYDALVATEIDDEPISLAYGGPVRMVIPHLYYWKSCKYLTGIRFAAEDERGFWEVRGYHNHADPWKEERYSSQEPGYID